MGFRFRRSVRIMPGFRVNVGKSGITSLSIGQRGITTNINAKGSKATFSLPGTGVSYSTDRSAQANAAPGVAAIVGGARGLVVAIFVVVAIIVAVLR